MRVVATGSDRSVIEFVSTAVTVRGAVLTELDATIAARWLVPGVAGATLDAELVELGGAGTGRTGLTGAGCAAFALLAAAFSFL